MNRNICIYQEFLTEAHKDRIRETARRTGFTPHFFNLDQFEEAKDCLQHCEVLYAHSADLLRAAPATLKWYCCSFAGVDLYCKGPIPIRQSRLPADQLQRLRRDHCRACGHGDR